MSDSSWTTCSSSYHPSSASTSAFKSPAPQSAQKIPQQEKYILLLGEGNFSFAASLSEALSLRKKESSNSSILGGGGGGYISDESGFASCAEVQENKDVQIIATDLNEEFISQEPNNSISQQQQISQNISKIRENGGLVLLNVDATRLHQHSQLLEYNNYHHETESTRQISNIIFNFPHVQRKKMQIGLNRQLLEKFFVSVSQFLHKSSLQNNLEDVEVIVTLCAGQSGVEQVENKKKRIWADSWQLIEMAAAGGFILKGSQPFEAFFEGMFKKLSQVESEEDDLLLQEAISYESTGFKNQLKSFHWKDANTFTFVYRKAPSFFSVEEEIGESNNNEEQMSGLFDSLEEQLALRIDSLARILNNVEESHPLCDFLKNFFNGATPTQNLRLCQNFTTTKDDDYTAKFEFCSGVELWIEGVRGENMYQKLLACFAPRNKSEFAELVKTFRLDDDDQVGKDDIFTQSVTIQGVPIGVVHNHGNKQFEAWDINLSSLLHSLKKKNQVDFRTIFSEYCRWSEDAIITPTTTTSSSSLVENFLGGKFTTGSYYPRTHSCDVSFWTTLHDCTKTKIVDEDMQLQHKNPVAQLASKVQKIAIIVYGTLLKSIKLLEEFSYSNNVKHADQQHLQQDEEICCRCQEKYRRLSYCFRIEIQSLDRPLNRSVAHFFLSKFKEGLIHFLNNVELR